MKNKKRKSGNVSFNVVVDTEDGEMIDYFWSEDHAQPPLIKPKKPPEGDSKRRPKPS